jgi:hypothetical protein
LARRFLLRKLIEKGMMEGETPEQSAAWEANPLLWCAEARRT